MKTHLEWALAYAALGWKVFPLRTSGDLKAPHPCCGKTGHLAATDDPGQLNVWWTLHPKAGIAVHLAASKLIVSDMDTHDNGVEDMARLEAMHGPLGTPVVALSGSAGKHSFFTAAFGLHPPGKLAGCKGIDLKYNGYVVLAPSPHCTGKPPVRTGKYYSWLPGNDPFSNAIPPMPVWFMERPELPATRAFGGVVDTDDIFGDAGQKAGLTLEDIQQLLLDVPNDVEKNFSYQEWLEILTGVFHETDGSAEAEAVMREWSQQSPKYTDEEFDKTWPSLDSRGQNIRALTVRKLIKLAQVVRSARRGEALREIKTDLTCAGTKEELTKVCGLIRTTELDALDRKLLAADVSKMMFGFTGVKLPLSATSHLVQYEDPLIGQLPPHLAGVVYLNCEEKFYLPNRSTYTRQGFDNTFDQHMLTHQDRLTGNANPASHAAAAALNLYKIPRVDRRMYLPTEEHFFSFNGVTCINTFTAASQPAIPARLTNSARHAQEVLAAHFVHMIPDERDRELFISWLAHIVKYQQRPNWAVVMQSPEGEGKTFIAALMGAILGAENVSIYGSNVIQGRFTDWAEGDLLKIIEEIKLHGNEKWAILDILKMYITNAMIGIEQKGMAPVTVPNTAGYLMLTNYRDALPLMVGDTRYLLLASPRQTPEEVDAFKRANPDYHTALWAIIVEHAGALRRWFLEHKPHPEFNAVGRAPSSTEKDYLMMMNKPAAVLFIEDILSENLGPALSRKLFSLAALQDHIDKVPYRDAPPSMARIGPTLQSMGFTCLGRPKIDGQKQTCYSATPTEFGPPHSEKAFAVIRDYLRGSKTWDL